MNFRFRLQFCEANCWFQVLPVGVFLRQTIVALLSRNDAPKKSIIAQSLNKHLNTCQADSVKEIHMTRDDDPKILLKSIITNQKSIPDQTQPQINTFFIVCMKRT